MCYFVFLASPLTLSEVRSMLPVGLAADLLSPAEQRAARKHHPDGQTVARVVHGACSCDLVTRRHPSTREDEAHLRARYRGLGLSRDLTIRALETHRRALERRQHPPDYWPAAFAGFVAEHARNAGPTMYYLGFSPDGELVIPADVEAPALIQASEVKRRPDAWLEEGKLTIVTR